VSRLPGLVGASVALLLTLPSTAVAQVSERSVVFTSDPSRALVIERDAGLLPLIEAASDVLPLAVAGLADTTLAAQQARIGTLIFPPDIIHTGWQCQSCGGLMADLTDAPPKQCIYCGGPLKEIPDIVTVAATQTMNLGGHVEVVRDKENQSVIKTHGGIGALLRY